MKRSIIIGLILSLFLIGCSEKLPENYGFYIKADNSEQFLIMEPQKIFFTGNLFQSVSGLKGAKGPECKDVKYFILFEKDINPKNIKLTKLEFQERKSVQNLFGGSQMAEVNLWLPDQIIALNISPFENKKDMYKLIPKEKLPEGFYALHSGGLGSVSTIEASIGNIAYDFVIGNKENFLSLEDKLIKEGEGLVKKFVSFYNDGDFINMKELFRGWKGENIPDRNFKYLVGLSYMDLRDKFGKIKDIKYSKAELHKELGLRLFFETTFEKENKKEELWFFVKKNRR